MHRQETNYYSDEDQAEMCDPLLRQQVAIPMRPKRIWPWHSTVLWLLVCGAFVANAAVEDQFIPVSKTVAWALACAACAFAFIHLFGAIMIAAGMRSVVREFKSTQDHRDTLLALTSIDDLEKQLSMMPTKEEMRKQLIQILLESMQDKELKKGLRDVMVEALEDEQVHSAAISGGVKGFVKSVTHALQK